MSKRYHRKDMRGPDSFQSGVERALEAAAPYARHIVIGFVALIVAALVVWGVQLQKNQARELFNADLTEAFRAYEQAFVDGLQGMEPDWDAVIRQLDTLYDQAPDKNARAKVLFYVVHASLEQGNLQRADSALQELRGATGNDPMMQAWAYYQLALLKERQGDREGAVTALEQAAGITPNPLGSLLESEMQRLSNPPLNPRMVAHFKPKPKPEAATAATP